jgi:hypothetical protein
MFITAAFVLQDLLNNSYNHGNKNLYEALKNEKLENVILKVLQKN